LDTGKRRKIKTIVGKRPYSKPIAEILGDTTRNAVIGKLTD